MKLGTHGRRNSTMCAQLCLRHIATGVRDKILVSALRRPVWECHIM